jgi:hypothetical protein
LAPTCTPTPNIIISLPNGTQIQSSSAAQLQIPLIPQSAQTAYLFPHLHTNSLLSVGQPCDAECTSNFNKNTVTIWLGNEKLLEGTHNHNTKLWSVPVPIKITTPHNEIHHSAQIVNHIQKLDQLVAFSHVALFAPSITTLNKAIQ